MLEGVFKVEADKESITCTLCKSSFKGDDHKTTIKYTKDHHNKVTGHRTKYLSHVDADFEVVRNDGYGEQTYEEYAMKTFKCYVTIMGMASLKEMATRSCLNAASFSIWPLASKHQQVSITKFFTSGPPDGANNS